MCNVCGKTLPTSRGVKIHLHSHKSKVQASAATIYSDSPKKPFNCHLCGRWFGMNQDRLFHLVTQAFSRADRFLMQVKNGWECTACDKVFNNRNQAEHHTRFHYSGFKLPCPVCREDFTGCKGLTLVKHVKDTHPEYFHNLD